MYAVRLIGHNGSEVYQFSLMTAAKINALAQSMDVEVAGKNVVVLKVCND